MPVLKAYGYKPDTVDVRDALYHPRLEMIDVAALPPKASLRSQMGKPYNQGELGSCTGNAISKHIEFLLRKLRGEEFLPSRLFVYYNEREMEGTVGEDAGAEIRDGIKSVGTVGICAEEDWEYDVDQFATKPSSKAYANALLHRAIKYQRVQIFSNRQRELTWTQMKACIAAGYPFVYGFNVPESFEGPEIARDGKMLMPEKGEQIVGGHAALAVGYDETMAAAGQSEFLETINSWEEDWGDKGYFWMPKAYAVNPTAVSDAWTIRSET